MRKIREKEKGKGEGRGNFIGLLFTEASPLTSSSSVAMASHRCRPFQRPPQSLWPPSRAENLPFSGTQVPMDEVCSSNQVSMDEMDSSNLVNVFRSMSSDQVWIELQSTLSCETPEPKLIVLSWVICLGF